MTARTYTQTARAESTAVTRRQVIDAAVAIFEAGDFEVPLERVSADAGVSTRTILRHFGSKDGLIEAAIADQTERIEAERAAPPGNAPAFVHALVAHYEEHGDQVMKLLAASDRFPLVARITQSGSRRHAAMVKSAFAADLEAPRGERRRRLALLVSVTDVYMWELLRRRQGMSRTDTEAAILSLVKHASEGAE